MHALLGLRNGADVRSPPRFGWNLGAGMEEVRRAIERSPSETDAHDPDHAGSDGSTIMTPDGGGSK